MDDTDEIVAEFLVESRENLDQLERDLVALEDAPGETAYIASIFRAIHTIKGTCGFLGFGSLESISHIGETLLSLLRDGKGTLTSDIATVLLAYVDAARRQLDSIEHTAEELDEDFGPLLADLKQCIEICERHQPGPANADCHTQAAPVDSTAGAVQATDAHIEPMEVRSPAQTQHAVVPVAEVAKAPAEPRSEGEAVGVGPSVGESSVRVQVQLLDRLMNLVGELVLARNAIVRFSDPSQDSLMAANVQRLNQLTTELQEGVMATRMQPIDNVWSKFPRVVRDLAKQCGKQVRLEMVGKDTGLDKTLIEAIKDPLTHLVRNSVDHGVETAAVRMQAGKPAEGRILLKAFHEGGQVNIEIGDDGAGISLEKVIRKARSQGLISEEEAQRMTPRQTMQLLFMPGFSTAEKVTNVSGRGVGMDVVKTNVERLGGSIEVDSVEGRGTVFRLKIPLTLAIVPALIVSVAGERYAVPQTNLLELVRVDAGHTAAIDNVMGSSVFQLRGRMVPLIYLGDELGVTRSSEAEPTTHHIIVLESEGQQFGMVVEDVCDSEEIVVKSLSKHIKGLGVYAGATIMGDGDVALIIDVAGLARRAGISAQRHSDTELATKEESELAAGVSESSLLLVEISGGLHAIPMDSVLRLEEVDRASVEHVGGRDVVQYRGDIMPLCWPEEQCPPLQDGMLRLAVFEVDGVPWGLTVDRVVDIVQSETALSTVGRRHGVRGTCVIRGKVTEVLEVRDMTQRAMPGNSVKEMVA